MQISKTKWKDLPNEEKKLLLHTTFFESASHLGKLLRVDPTTILVNAPNIQLSLSQTKSSYYSASNTIRIMKNLPSIIAARRHVAHETGHFFQSLLNLDLPGITSFHQMSDGKSLCVVKVTTPFSEAGAHFFEIAHVFNDAAKNKHLPINLIAREIQEYNQSALKVPNMPILCQECFNQIIDGLFFNTLLSPSNYFELHTAIQEPHLMGHAIALALFATTGYDTMETLRLLFSSEEQMYQHFSSSSGEGISELKELLYSSIPEYDEEIARREITMRNRWQKLEKMRETRRETKQRKEVAALEDSRSQEDDDLPF
jgi:hypothetical protein